MMQRCSISLPGRQSIGLSRRDCVCWRAFIITLNYDLLPADSCDSRYCDNSDLRMDTAYTGADRDMYWSFGGKMQDDMLKGETWQRDEKSCVISERKAKIQRADKLNERLISFWVLFIHKYICTSRIWDMVTYVYSVELNSFSLHDYYFTLIME